MQYEKIPPFILIDSAYPSTKHTVPTFKTTECRRNPLVKQLNRKLGSIRYCIEQAFGICKNRFRVFNRPLECAKDDVTQATKLITAIFTLHNFLLDEESDDDIEDEDLIARMMKEMKGKLMLLIKMIKILVRGIFFF